MSDARRLYHLVADQIRAVIEQGGFMPGSRLPPERELAQQLGVSRPSLREALIALEIEGRVEIRMSSGVYVCATPAAALIEAHALGESPSELMQARAVIEGSIVSLAAANVSEQGLERIRACLDAMRADMRRGPSLQADRRFHVAIAELAGNSILSRLVGDLFDGRQGAISSRMTRDSESAQASWEAALQEHEDIVRALESRDPHAASAAMVAHLRASRERWL
jgi:DNA-binding FadR family transcriptional regulator